MLESLKAIGEENEEEENENITIQKNTKDNYFTK